MEEYMGHCLLTFFGMSAVYNWILAYVTVDSSVFCPLFLSFVIHLSE